MALRRRAESGATTVTIAILLVGFIAALGIGVDFTKFALESRRVQNAADEAALALGGQYARGLTPAATVAQSLVDGNAGSGVPTPVAGAVSGSSVSITVDKVVGYNFLRVLGFEDRVISRKATASWNGTYPKVGTPAVPFAVANCLYENNKPATGQLSGNQVLIRSDLFQSVSDLNSSLLSSLGQISAALRGVVSPVDDLVRALTDASGTTCQEPGGLLSLQGGVWLSELLDTALLQNLNLLQAQASCDVELGSGLVGDALVYVGGMAQQALISKCASRFGTEIQVGDIILLPVYRPANSTDLGLEASTCVVGTCVHVPPYLNASITGWAPFKVTGWRFGTNVSSPAPAQCDNVSLRIPLEPLVTELLKGTITVSILSSLGVVGNLLNIILGGTAAIVASLLDLIGPEVVHATVLGCNALQGHFTHTVQPFPDFEYTPDGSQMGATTVRLSE